MKHTISGLIVTGSLWMASPVVGQGESSAEPLGGQTPVLLAAGLMPHENNQFFLSASIDALAELAKRKSGFSTTEQAVSRWSINQRWGPDLHVIEILELESSHAVAITFHVQAVTFRMSGASGEHRGMLINGDGKLRYSPRTSPGTASWLT